MCVRRKGGEGGEALTLEVGSEYHLVSKELPFLGSYSVIQSLLCVACIRCLFTYAHVRGRAKICRNRSGQ